MMRFLLDALERIGGRGKDRATSSLDEDESQWLLPPATVSDPATWDAYWNGQVEHGVAGLVHLLVDNGRLIDAMRANGLRTVLCAGNGVSLEPLTLAAAGFDVTVLDLSDAATTLVRNATLPPGRLSTLTGGRTLAEGGRATLVTGDITDPGCCPGPYDVIIERKTLQLWPGASLGGAARALANRLASRGIFLSHCHDGAWRPGREARMPTAAWFASEGWPVWREGDTVTGRVAWLVSTTG